MRVSVVLVLAVLSLGWLGLDAAWLAADHGIQETDAAYHFSRVAGVRAKLLGVDPTGGFDGQRYGALVYWLAGVLSLGVGIEPARLLLALAVLLRPLTVVGFFFLGSELARPDRRTATGLLTAALAPLLPGLVNYGRVLVLDLPLTVAVTWAAVFGLRAVRAGVDGRSRRRDLWTFGGLSAVALLIKLNAVAFLLAPAWVALRPDLKRLWGDPRRRRAVLGGGAALLVVLGAGLLLGTRGEAIRRTLTEATWPGALVFGYVPDGSVGRFVGDWLGTSLDHSWEAAYFTWLQTLTPPLCLVGLASYVWYFARRYGCEDPVGHPQRDVAFWWFLVPVVFVVLLLRGLYDERYVLPLLPLTAALIAAAVMDLRGWRRGLGVGVLLLGGALNHAWVHHDWWPTSRPLACAHVPAWTTSERVGGTLWACLGYPEYQFMDRLATPEPLPPDADAVSALLAPVRAARGEPLRAVFLDEAYGLFYAMHQQSLLADDPLLLEEHALLVTECWDTEQMRAMFREAEEVERQILAADVVVMRLGSRDDGSPGLRGKRCAFFWSHRDRFEDAGEAPMGDGTVMRVWRRVW